MEASKVPLINSRIICISDMNQVSLTAVISSYLFEKDTYLPLFIFPKISHSKEDDEGDDFMKDGYISKMIGNEIGVVINNALARMETFDYVVFAGLSTHQKSYIHLPKRIKIIDIANIDEVHGLLGELCPKKDGEIRCNPLEILKGLYLAQQNNKILVIDEKADSLINPEYKEHTGLIVVEDIPTEVFSLIGVNYASAVDADIEIVNSITKKQSKGIEDSIQKWNGKYASEKHTEVIEMISVRVGHLDFTKYQYVTFFTIGLPYSLGIQNIIPCSYVHLHLKPDLFIINSILFEGSRNFGSAVIFSPIDEFTAVDETLWLKDFFEKNNFYLRFLAGRDATVSNLDFNVHHFPYDILHISSHGGEINGYEVEDKFTDRDGLTHTVIYHEVVGFSPAPGIKKIAVERKVFFQKFNGYEWMSEELELQKNPSYIYEDMRKAFFNKKMSKGVARKPIARVATSCAIRCNDHIHQGTFRSLASHHSPIIFHNACCSWHEMSKFFIAGGARVYIGTMWNIELKVATSASKIFYENISKGTLLSAFHLMMKSLKGNAFNKNIFIFWGLHFTSIQKPTSYTDSREKVFRELIRSYGVWEAHAKSAKIGEVKENSIRITKELDEEIETNFNWSDMDKLEKEAIKKIHQSYPDIFTKEDVERAMNEDLSI